MCVCVYLSVCLSVYQSINLSKYQSISLSIVEQVQQPHTYKQRVPMAHVLRYFSPMLSSTRRWFPGD